MGLSAAGNSRDICFLLGGVGRRTCARAAPESTGYRIAVFRPVGLGLCLWTWGLPGHPYDGAGRSANHVHVVDETGDDGETEAAREHVPHVVDGLRRGVVAHHLEGVGVVVARCVLTRRVRDDRDERVALVLDGQR